MRSGETESLHSPSRSTVHVHASLSNWSTQFAIILLNYLSIFCSDRNGFCGNILCRPVDVKTFDEDWFCVGGDAWRRNGESGREVVGPGVSLTIAFDRMVAANPGLSLANQDAAVDIVVFVGVSDAPGLHGAHSNKGCCSMTLASNLSMYCSRSDTWASRSRSCIRCRTTSCTSS